MCSLRNGFNIFVLGGEGRGRGDVNDSGRGDEPLRQAGNSHAIFAERQGDSMNG